MFATKPREPHTITVEQATFSRYGADEPELLACSPGFSDQWRIGVLKILVDFGSRPAGWTCPSAVFAQPFGRQLVMVVHAADLGDVKSSMPPVGFHVLLVPREPYQNGIHEPFLVAERFAPDWQTRGTLPELHWSESEAPQPRTVEQVRAVLKRVKGQPLAEDVPVDEQVDLDPVEQSESPALLGGVQVLVDGGRLVFERPAPDTDLLRALWTLLPCSNRGELWPASFAFSNKLQFDVVVTPRADGDEFVGYTDEEQAADYPEGRYELHLQMAAESGNQGELDSLLARRSWRESWKLGLIVLVVVAVIATTSRFIVPPPPGDQPTVVDSPYRHQQSAIIAGVTGIGRPLETITILPVARERFNELERANKKAGEGAR